jgi:hypothetical protein
MIAWREVGKFFEMFWPQRLGNRVLTPQPFAEVDQAATLGTKRAELSGEPITFLPTGRTLIPGHGNYFVSATIAFRSVTTSTAASNATSASTSVFWTLS